MKKFVLLNGPPRSGKDTAAEIILKEYEQDAVLYKMTSPIDLVFKDLFLIPANEWNDYREVRKDEKQELFNNHSLREMFIRFSEVFAKPMLGKECFGKMAVAHTKILNEEIVVISDVGFEDEITPLINHYGTENFILIRMHRAGYDYTNDSRSYIRLGNVLNVDIENSDIVKLREDVINIARNFLK